LDKREQDQLGMQFFLIIILLKNSHNTSKNQVFYDLCEIKFWWKKKEFDLHAIGLFQITQKK